MTPEQLEQLARAIHERYRLTTQASGNLTRSPVAEQTWEELPEERREDNRAQARDIPLKLHSLRLRVVKLEPGEMPLVLAEADVEAAAKIEHERWMMHKVETGWSAGEKRNDAAKVHHLLKPWESLTDTEQELDRVPVRQVPELLAMIGFGVRPIED
jgi:hypothetical protein